MKSFSPTEAKALQLQAWRGGIEVGRGGRRHWLDVDLQAVEKWRLGAFVAMNIEVSARKPG